ncbi:MAG: AzlC family ABC transporter permease [Hungatella sp.]|nr:AzlC family ABC transporter permease [Hungatella sp.]
MHQHNYIRGMRQGIPVGLGYFVVSFTIGIAARKADLTPVQAAVMSFTNNTSAGQFASFALIASGAPYLEMAISQAVINLRYCLMSCALSQKLDKELPFYHRLFVAFGVTDEIFGLSISQKGKLDPWYTYGVMSVAIPGWSLGTLAGVLSTGVLPQTFLNAMNMALYGMFIAIFMPAAREDKKLLPIIAAAMALSALVHMAPLFDFISSGMKIIVLTLAISGAAAVLMPVPEEEV